MDKRVDQFHASSTSLSRERRATRMAVQRRLFAVCRGKLDSNWQFEFIPEALLAILPSIFETDFSFAREKRIFNSLSNFLRSNNCPVISKPCFEF